MCWLHADEGVPDGFQLADDPPPAFGTAVGGVGPAYVGTGCSPMPTSIPRIVLERAGVAEDQHLSWPWTKRVRFVLSSTADGRLGSDVVAERGRTRVGRVSAAGPGSQALTMSHSWPRCSKPTLLGLSRCVDGATPPTTSIMATAGAAAISPSGVRMGLVPSFMKIFLLMSDTGCRDACGRISTRSRLQDCVTADR